jgi:hypothetical protein
MARQMSLHFACSVLLLTTASGLRLTVSDRSTKNKKSQVSQVPRLEGKQWCDGDMPADIDEGKVAIMMIGQPFRSKNFYELTNYCDCMQASLEPQHDVARSHLTNLIQPIEAMGFKTDVYFTEAPCTCGARNNEKVWAGDFNVHNKLTEFYGAERVRSTLTLSSWKEGNMFTHIRDMYDHVKDAAKKMGKNYAYYVVLRYDVMIDKPFLPSPDASLPHRGLSFFRRSHDYMHAFPGEMSNCMLNLWDGCLTKCPMLTEKCGEQQGCYKMGPVTLEKFYEENGGYANVMLSIGHSMCSSKEVIPGSCDEFYNDEPLKQLGTTLYNSGQKERYAWVGPSPFGEFYKWNSPDNVEAGQTAVKKMDGIEQSYLPTYYHIG